jgi:hypothetical protein
MRWNEKLTPHSKLLIGLIVWTGFFAVLSAPSLLTHAQDSKRQPEMGGGPTVSPEKGYVVQHVRDGLYWVSDGAYNTMFLVTSNGVIAVDAPPTLGPNYLRAIAEVTLQRK